MKEAPGRIVTTIITNDTLEDTIQMTTEPRHATRRAGERDEWWKLWILLSSLGATVVGWMALPGIKSPADGVVVSSTATTMSAEVHALPVDAVVEPGRPGPSVRSIPTMPQKPVFEAPVTRTRRS